MDGLQSELGQDEQDHDPDLCNSDRRCRSVGNDMLCFRIY